MEVTHQYTLLVPLVPTYLLVILCFILKLFLQKIHSYLSYHG